VLYPGRGVVRIGSGLRNNLAQRGVDPALVAGRPVRSVDPKEGLFIDEEGNSYRLAVSAAIIAL
jgi:hypothetical protein